MLIWSALYFALSFGSGLSGVTGLVHDAQPVANVLFFSFMLLALLHMAAWLYRLRIGETSLRNWAEWRPVSAQREGEYHG